ncbi:MAG TPA: M4 family metallopeptidase [Thermoanaerobaculia bacterium]|nr:M4 family metallopeptidase [Thermoanaerobaculia bacterium]
MKKLLAVILLLSTTAVLAQDRFANREVRVRNIDSNGVASFITGNLGKLLGPGSVEKSARTFLRSQTDLLPMDGTEDFEPIRTERDSLGQTHIKLQERFNGLPIVGAEYIVHSDSEGRVIAMNGRFIKTRELPRVPQVDAWTATEKAVAQRGVERPTYFGKPELTYVSNEKGNTFLAWASRIAYTNEVGPQVDMIYADAITGDLALVAPQYFYLKNRQTYTANNTTTLPGTLKRSEGSANIGDAALDAAHNNAGAVYDYYKNVHGRDSYDNAGATLKASVHYSTRYNNAFWNGSQMVYGDGDGTTFIALSQDLDVDAHELTHAVTERTAGLVYSNESGALNEATSDILGNACEAYTENGGTPNSNTWKVGEDIYTPGTAGDALRFMNDPAGQGDSDYYPTRYTGTTDNGGVHTNSGIANLAFYLMVMGGTHPRGKTSVNVTPLSTTSSTSLTMGGKIWYRALTVYMTSSTNFSAARTATANAATDLYGAAAAATVNQAWDAVGAPGGGGGGGGTTTVLTNGVAVTGIGAATGSWKHYKITVPSGQSSLVIAASGGSGDADMYVKLGSQPTLTSYNYRPYLNGNNETVTVSNPAAGDWYVSLYAYSTFSSVTLKATYSAAATCTNESGSLSGTGANWYSAQYTSSVSGTHTAKLTGTGTDFDLYLQKWNGTSWAQVAASEGATATENISYSGTSGTYRYRVYAYSGGGSLNLCTTHP